MTQRQSTRIHPTRYERPWRLSPDNFTPPSRTPWGGTRILAEYKRGLALSADKAAYRCVGEAWDVSIDETFPSRLCDEDLTLAEAIAADPIAALGAALADAYGNLSVLVKTLDAAEALSVQVHPADGDPRLGAGQCGKPESWFVLDAAPGAGVYLGFAEGVRRADVEACLAHNHNQGGDLSKLMNFIPVQRGDVFAIEPGLVHALGPGVSLIEPQRVQPGREGVTYRFWDWNRLYDGKPRALHVEESLAVSDFDLVGDAIIAKARRQGRVEQTGFTAELFTGDTVRAPQGVLSAFVVGGGEVRVTGDGGEHVFRRGEAFVLPAEASRRCTLAAHDAFVVVTTPRV